jgi:hypothetical protein
MFLTPRLFACISQIDIPCGADEGTYPMELFNIEYYEIWSVGAA